jgi:hypothetical protein
MSDLFDFFKENEDKLRNNPSSQVWSKLEQQLVARKRKRRRKLFLQTVWIAITIALLVLAASMVYLMG